MARLCVDVWRSRRPTLDGLDASCRGFCSLPGPLQTVQRAELWEVILALQAADAVHLGVDHLNVVRDVGRCSMVVPWNLRMMVT